MQSHRTCNKCGETKPKEDFYIRRRRGRVERRHQCKACERQRLSQYNENSAPGTPEYERERWLIKQFGIDIAGYESILAAQGGRCAICSATACSDGRRLHVDHCHRTRAIRGLLCAACNRGVGLLDDDPERLILAAAYLEREGDWGLVPEHRRPR